MKRQYLGILALNPAWFLTPQMALPYFNTHNFATAGDMKTALSSLMRLKLRHLKAPR